MTQNRESDDNSPHSFDPQFQTEDIAFHPKEMVQCGDCARSNPPNRLYCLYCGGELDVQIDAAVKTNRRKLELWERGFNVILREGSVNKAIANDIAELLSIEIQDVSAILDAGCPLPLSRVESEKEASMIVERLTQLGIRTLVVRDEKLAPDKPLVRLGSIEDQNDSLALKDFNTGKTANIACSELPLIVAGVIAEGKIDTIQKTKIRGETKLVDETITASDESVIDIYVRDHPLGFRVRMAGFDFSCLGDKKSLLATENMRSLMTFLKDRAPNAKIVDNYPVIRGLLGMVWENESRKTSKGLRRGGFGKVDVASEATTSNLNQFTKYSRLQWHLL